MTIGGNLRTLVFCCLWLLADAGPGQAWAGTTVIRTPITESEKHKVDAFLAGRSPLDIDHYQSPQLDSIAPVENILFRKAVLLGGLDAVFEDVIVPNTERARDSLKSGQTLGGGDAQWHSNYLHSQNKVFESDVVIASGWYEKGLYTTKEKCNKYNIKSLADLHRLTAVTSNTWAIDWRTLSDLGLANLFSAPTRPLQFKMIEGGRADFTLQDFSALKDLSIEEGGVRLFPIRNVKIALRGTRHFFINRNQPESRAVFDAMQRGLRIMQKQGEIKRALVEAGVMNMSVKNWTLLN
jgi:ABC-type amino acid transport substrate-binding protein